MDVNKDIQDESLGKSIATCLPSNHLTVCCSGDSEGTTCPSSPKVEEYPKTQKELKTSMDATPRDFRLFEQWADKASGAISVYCRFSIPALENFNPNQDAFFIRVNFDYNQKNFRPVDSAPEILRLNDNSSNQKRDPLTLHTQSVNNHNHNNNNMEEVKAVSTGIIKYKDYMLTIPIYLDFTKDDAEVNDETSKWNSKWIVKYEQDQLRHKMFNDIQLQSSIFARWTRVETENRHKSYDHLMSTERFAQFMIHALHLPCRRPRHCPDTCVVMLVITFGFALGQIESLDKFFVLPRTDALGNLEVWYHLTPEARKRLEKQCMSVETTGRDTMDQGVGADDGSVDTTVILLAHASRKMFVQHFVISSTMRPQESLHPCVCDQKAKYHFKELQKQSPCALDSPCLNEIVDHSMNMFCH